MDGPSTGVPRMAANFKSLYLTDFKVKIQHSTRSKGVRKVLEEADILTKWNETACAKKMAQRRLRKGLSDFDRFKVKILKQQVHSVLAGHKGVTFIVDFVSCILQKMRIVRGEVKKLKKQN